MDQLSKHKSMSIVVTYISGFDGLITSVLFCRIRNQWSVFACVLHD